MQFQTVHADAAPDTPKLSLSLASTPEEVREIQQLLTRAGHDVGGADGKVGISTRAAIKTMQMKFGLPADSYPSPELLARLRAGR